MYIYVCMCIYLCIFLLGFLSLANQVFNSIVNIKDSITFSEHPSDWYYFPWHIAILPHNFLIKKFNLPSSLLTFVFYLIHYKDL